MTTIPLPCGHVIDVTGSHGASARIAFYPGNSHTVTFNHDQPDTRVFGPFERDVSFTFESLAGSPTWASSCFIPSAAAIAAATDRIRSARVIATALNEGSKAMALVDKFRTIAARSHAIPKRLEERADALAARLDAVEARGDKAFSGHEDFLAGVESGVAAAEDALNQLTNGGPVG